MVINLPVTFFTVQKSNAHNTITSSWTSNVATNSPRNKWKTSAVILKAM